VHVCGLSFDDAEDTLQSADEALSIAQTILDETISIKINTLMTPAIRERLEQGRKEKPIAEMLKCETAEKLRDTLKRLLLEDDNVVELINRYLKKIIVVQVNLSDFKPSLGSVEPDQIPQVAQEFQEFLKQAAEDAGNQDDELPVLQIE
jgi:hypothetical protein